MIAINSAETYSSRCGSAAAALAQRNSEYGERIEHQAATIDVLKVMSASPGDPQPVFDLIVERARDLCERLSARPSRVRRQAAALSRCTGIGATRPRAIRAAMFPMVPDAVR